MTCVKGPIVLQLHYEHIELYGMPDMFGMVYGSIRKHNLKMHSFDHIQLLLSKISHKLNNEKSLN